MKIKFRYIIILASCISLSCDRKPEPLVYPSSLKIIDLGHDTTMVCFDCENKVVVFHNFNNSSFYGFSEIFGWKETARLYPEVSFLFYFSGDDDVRLERELGEMEFPFPVIFDPEFEFYNQNKLDTVGIEHKHLLSFLVKNDISIGFAEIGMKPHFEKQLDKMIDPNSEKKAD